MYGQYFTYNGHSSLEFGLIMGSINANSDIPLAMSRNILKGGINRYRSNPNHMGTSWSDVLSFNISVVKDPCVNQDGQNMVFTEEEVDEINKWLTSPDYPLLFHMYDYDYKDNELTDCLEEDTYWFTTVERWDPDSSAFEDYKMNESDDSLIIINDTGYYKVIWDGTTYYCDVKYSEKHECYYIGNLNMVRELFETFADTGEPFVVLSTDGKFKTNFVLSSGNIKHIISAKYSPKHHYHLSEYDYYGIFSNVSPLIIAGDIVGFDMTFITNSPFAWTNLKNQRFWCNNQQDDGVELHVTVDHSEQNREVYPVIAITNRFGPLLVRIKCMTDNGKVMRINIPGGTDTMVIDCRKAMIYDSKGLFTFDSLGISDVDYLYWPKLYDGLNRIIISGSYLEVRIQWREARKVGAY